MKKSPASKKGETYVVSGSRKSKEGKTTKVYRKDGSLKSERNIKDSGTKKETRYTASPRTLTTKKKQVDVKDPATRSYTKYKKDGTVKKSITAKEAANKKGTGVDVKVSRKVDRKIRRDKRGAKNMTFKQDQRKDVDVKRTPVKLKKSPSKMKKSPSNMKDKSMAKMKDKSMAKMKDKSPAKKPLVGKQKNLPKELRDAILKAPAKMLTKSGIKMMKEVSPTKLKKKESPAKMKAPMKKSKKRVEQDYARNAIADYKAGKKKQGNYEKKKALELAAGESGVMMKTPMEMKKNPMMMKKNPMMMKKNPMMMKTNQSGGGYAAKNPAAPARQLKKLGSVLSKHMKSN